MAHTPSAAMGVSISRDELEKRLPYPILPNRPELVELYWRCWELAARMIRHGTPDNGFAPTYMDAAFGGNIFQEEQRGGAAPASSAPPRARISAGFAPGRLTADS